jgi:signal transduction histidine kinase
LSIKSRLFLTIFSIFLASTTVMGFYSYRSQVNRLKESLKDLARNENWLFHTLLTTDSEGLARAQTGLTRLDPLLSLFAEKQRGQLLAKASPIFVELEQGNSITHMYFIEPDGTVFLRVHNPEQYGDRLTRATYTKAAKGGKTACGLEMGKNFFSLRCVTPLTYQEEMIGFFEVAEEIDHIFDQMKAATGNDVSLFLIGEFLKRQTFDYSTEKIGDFSILYPTDKTVTLQLATRFNETIQKGLQESVVSFVDLHGAKYAIGVGPVRDAFGVTAGILLSHRDISPLYSAMWKGIITSITAFAAIFLTCTALLYLSLRKRLILFNTLRNHIQSVTRTWNLTECLEDDTRDEIGDLVGDFKLMQDEIRKQKDSLEMRAEELSAANRELEAFSYSLSHDLRLPLTQIYAAAQLLWDGYADDLDETGGFLIRNICEASEGMENLIQAMLVLSRTTRNEMHQEEVDLSILASKISADLLLFEPERKVEWVIPAGLTTRGDPQLLKVALKNLMENALKYTRTFSQPQIELGMIDQQGKQVFFVRDNGVGFDMKDADKLFKPFQRLHNPKEFPGTGIGLATVQRIIQRHGGDIWAKGEPGKGAVFFFSLT